MLRFELASLLSNRQQCNYKWVNERLPVCDDSFRETVFNKASQRTLSAEFKKSYTFINNKIKLKRICGQSIRETFKWRRSFPRGWENCSQVLRKGKINLWESCISSG